MGLNSLIATLGGSLAEGHGGEGVLYQMIDTESINVKAAADGMASDATADTLVWMNPYDFTLQLIGWKAVGAAGLTAHDTNFATITLKTDDGAGGAKSVAASLVTTLTGGTGTWSTGVAKTAVLTPANVKLLPGACAWFNIAKAAAGVVVPISHYLARWRRIG